MTGLLSLLQTTVTSDTILIDWKLSSKNSGSLALVSHLLVIVAVTKKVPKAIFVWAKLFLIKKEERNNENIRNKEYFVNLSIVCLTINVAIVRFVTTMKAIMDNRPNYMLITFLMLFNY